MLMNDQMNCVRAYSKLVDDASELGNYNFFLLSCHLGPSGPNEKIFFQGDKFEKTGWLLRLA